MEIAIIDIETTGFLNAGGKIVEIGIVLLNLDNGKITPLMNFVTNEDGITKPEILKSWIVQNSSLTVDEIRYGVNLKFIKNSIQAIAGLYPVTAFNRAFDIGFLENRGVVFPNRYPCPMLELTPIMKLPNIRGGFKWPKVEEAWSYFFPDEPYVELHRGFDDVIHEAKIVYELHKLKNK